MILYYRLHVIFHLVNYYRCKLIPCWSIVGSISVVAYLPCNVMQV